MLGGLTPKKSTRIKAIEPRAQQSLRQDDVRYGVFDHIVEAAKRRLVEELGMVCRGDDQPTAFVLLEKLQEGIQHAADFANILTLAAASANGVELVESINSARCLHGIEYQVLAGELHLPLFTIVLDGLITKFMGETAAKLRRRG